MANRRAPNAHGVIPEDETLDMEAMRVGREAVRGTWFVFEDNANEWIQFEARLNEGTNYLAFWSSDRHASELLREPSRRLHNFLASAASLVDHTRNHVNRAYSAHSFRDEYQAQINALFADKPMPEFIGNLRNFALHYRLPLRSASLTLTSPPRHAFLLMRDDLLGTGFNWGAVSKKYLQDSPESIEISPIVGEYRAIVNGFHKWREEEEQVLARRALEAQNGPNSLVARRARGETV